MASGSDRVRVDVLGPIRVTGADDADLTPDGPLQRRLLAYLVLQRGRVVSADSAIDVLWPTDTPRDPVGALQNHLSRLRGHLPDGVIESVGAGYRLDPTRIEVDADRLAEALSSGDPAVLADVDAILARWRGPAYPELDEVDDGRAEAVRLTELRVRAQELRAEHRLAAGDTDGLVAELHALVAEEPLREQPRVLLMAALATTGRQVEALRVYDDFRRLLGDELGTEPSPELVAQHAQLLAGSDVAGWAPASRLPVPVSSLVGRDALVGEVAALVGGHRLVTLVGPGGVGKTRLLVEVGHRLRASDPDRPVVLCELATADRASVLEVIAAALGIDARPGVALAERVIDVVGDTEIVVLLDNCEHVLDPAAELTERLLATCPQVTVVATSRERLRVPGEQVGAVPTLSAGAEDAPAVQLFVQRAQAVAPGFAPEAGDLARITEIVGRLDGLPLAIELAAARLHTHDLEEIAAGLDHRFSLLATGYRTSARHGSLWAAASWSFEMLDEALRSTFANLSVFSGPFSAADAAIIGELSEDEATALLAQLVERSLVMRAPRRRYVLLETLRAFGSEQLADEGRADVIGERHALHQVEWVEGADRRLLEPGHPVFAEIDDALPELRGALGWLLDHERLDLAGRLIEGLLDYGVLRLRPDVLAWSERVAEADPEDRSPLAPLVWVAAAYAAWMAGDVAETGVRSERARAVAERTGGDLPAQVATISGSHALFEGRLDDAVTWYRRAQEAAGEDTARRLMAAGSELLPLGYARRPEVVDRAELLLQEVGEPSTPWAAYVWYCAGEAALAVGDERARDRLARAVELAEATNASFVTGVAGASKASIDARGADPAAAAAAYRRLLTDGRRAGMRSTQWTLLRSIAALLDRLGRHRDAAVLEGAVRSTAAGHRIFGADEVALEELGTRLRSELGDEAYEAARAEGATLDGDAAVDYALRVL